MIDERGLTFQCGGETLVGVLAEPAGTPVLPGVVIVVGGPQYRIGSHRQFVELARALARAGHPCLRFDVRGMGDSTGTARSFEDIGDDIDAAISALQIACPTVTKIVLWGLCDGASAAAMFAAHSSRLGGLVLVNPWVRTETTLARTHVRHYYAARLMQPGFWTKLVSGNLDVRAALGELLAKLRSLRTSAQSREKTDYRSLMLEGLRRFDGPVLLITAEGDLTAREFLDLARDDDAWHQVLDRLRPARCVVADADHTFSRAEWSRRAEEATVAWLRRV